MSKRYFLNGKEITAERARELDKQNQKLIASGTLEDLVKCKVICTADSKNVTFGMSPAPAQAKPKKPAAGTSASKSKAAKPTAGKTAAKKKKKSKTKGKK